MTYDLCNEFGKYPTTYGYIVPVYQHLRSTPQSANKPAIIQHPQQYTASEAKDSSSHPSDPNKDLSSHRAFPVPEPSSHENIQAINEDNITEIENDIAQLMSEGLQSFSLPTNVSEKAPSSTSICSFCSNRLPHPPHIFQRLNAIPVINNGFQYFSQAVQAGSSQCELFKKGVETSISTFKPVWDSLEPTIDSWINMIPYLRYENGFDQGSMDKKASVGISSSEGYTTQSLLYLFSACFEYLRGAETHMILLKNRITEAIEHANASWKETIHLNSPYNESFKAHYSSRVSYYIEFLPTLCRSVQKDVAETLRKVVNLVSRFALALPANLKLQLKEFILSLPRKWAAFGFSLIPFSSGWQFNYSMEYADKMKSLLDDSIAVLRSIETIVMDHLVSLGLPESSLAGFRDSLQKASQETTCKKDDTPSREIQLEPIPQQYSYSQS